MKIADTIIPQFDHEMAVTRKVLERIPDDKFDWKPHSKSMTLGNLVSHLAEIPGWTVPTIAQPSLDLAPVGGTPFATHKVGNRQEALSQFDKNVAAAKEILPTASDQNLLEPWALMAAGSEIFKMPRVAVLRSFIISHLIHHRAQLGVYLRLNDISHPAIYGPSADEEN